MNQFGFVKLKDVCTFYTGTGFPTKYQGRERGKYPFYKVGDISKNAQAGNKYLQLCDNFVDDEDVVAIKGNIIPSNTIVFAKIGEAVKLNRRAITETSCLVDNNVMGIAPDESEMSLDYFYYFMRNLKMETLAESTTVPSVRKSRLEELKIQVPTLDIQEIICKKLNSTERIMVKRRQQLEEIDMLIKARFVEMFGNPEDSGNEWEQKPLSDLLNVIGGYAFKSDQFSEIGGIPVLRIGNINAGVFRPVNMVYWEDDEKLERYAIYAGDLVMSLTGTVGKDDYGNVCIMGNEYDKYYLNQRNAKLEIKSGLDKYYLSELLKFECVKKKLTGISRGVRQANISNKDILNLVVNVPPIELQNQFAAFVTQVDKLKFVETIARF